MKSFILLVFAIIGTHSIGQMSNTEEKRIKRILGDDFVELPTEKSYGNNFACTPCQLDTSMVLIGKSDGGYFNNEFVLYHNSISFKANSEVLKLMRKSYVTVDEYERFENWVRDSIARTRLAIHVDRWQRTESYADFEPESEDGSSGGYFIKSLKWSRRFSYEDSRLKPCLSDMYLPQPQRFYRQRIFDKRKYSYRYIDEYEQLREVDFDSIQFYVKDAYRFSERYDSIEYDVPIFRDEFVLGKGSTFVRDERSALLHLRENYFTKFPVNGIRGFQAEAFCHWKAREIQNQLNSKGINYSVRVTLPLVKDVELVDQNQLDEIIVSEKDYTDQWIISNKGYLDFMKFVKDSITKKYLYVNLKDDKEALQLINFEKSFFDESSIEMVDLDISDRRFNHWYFYLNKNYKINLRDTSISRLVNSLADDELYFFQYWDMNFEKRAEDGEYQSDDDRYKRTPPIAWTLKLLYSDGEPFGKDWVIGQMNPLNEAKSTRSHTNIQRFIEPNRIDIRPTNLGHIKPDDSIITTISYEQALAFYHWKFPIEKINKKSNWQDFVLPTKEQYQSIQQGNRVIFPEHTIDYEGPFFKYVVHFFPK